MASLAVQVVGYLLKHHFAGYFPRVEAKIRAGDRNRVRRLAHCRIMAEAKQRVDEIDALLREFSTEEEPDRWVWEPEGPAHSP